jgi:alpha-glucosidase (family GH31 glycosyl hydrolase)
MQLHNNFSCAWLETVSSAFFIAAQQLNVSDDFVAFARSGCISAAKHSRLFWAGDQLTSWDPRDGIGSALTAVCSPDFLLNICSPRTFIYTASFSW